MAQVGSNRGMVSQSLAATTDPQGNAIVSSDTFFGSSPAGIAMLTQQLFGLANATFNLTPADVYSPISQTNQLPYWSFAEYSDGVMSGSAIYDSTTQTWGVILDPGTAVSGDYCLLTTRSYLINDDGLGLRQRAFSVLSKSGTAAGTAQWNLTLSATYYSAADSALSTAIIGTVYDTAAFTSLAGTTTSGGSAISASARYVDLEFKLSATTTITGSAKPTIKSLLLSTSSATSNSFLVAETFTSSQTWTVPTGVTNLVAVAAVGAGGGGAGGSLAGARQSGQNRCGGGGGGGGAPYLLLRDVSLGTATSVAIGIGAGGAGGTAVVATKPASNSTTYAIAGGVGAAGGNTTFGSLFTITGGGGGGAAATPSIAAVGVAAGTGGAAGSYTSSYFTALPGTPFTTATGGVGGSASTVQTFSQAGTAGGYGAVSGVYPYLTAAAGVNGGTASIAGTAVTSFTGAAGTAAAGTAATFGGGGGGASSVGGSASAAVSAGGNSGGAAATFQGAGGAAGGGILARITGGTGSLTVTAGAGGAAAAYSGGAGGAGGAVGITTDGGAAAYDSRPFTATTGVGGKGSDASIVVVYIA